ncbi:hypothetical protein, partial [Serratia nevei]
VILVGLAIDQIAQSGLSSLSVIYYSAQLFSVGVLHLREIICKNPHPPPAHIANLAAPKVITSSKALISSVHCSHYRLSEYSIVININMLVLIKGSLC